MTPLHIATKPHLQRTRRALAAATKSHHLLDKKSRALHHAVATAKKQADAWQQQLTQAWPQAYQALLHATQDIGHPTVMAAAACVPPVASILPPPGEAPLRPASPPYPLAGSTALLDTAYLAWQHLVHMALQLAAAQKALHQLIIRHRRTQRKTAALQYIVIPTYSARIQHINAQLEERARDELARLRFAAVP